MSKLYSGTVIVLATLTPRPGKLQAVLELAQPVIQYAQDYEKGCFEFQVFTEVNPEGVEQIFTIERFKDTETLALHQANEALEVFNKAIKDQDLLETDIVSKNVKAVAGFVVV
ncbi:hypothetical protein ACQKWADRAFT_307555 [Trichoderma austrokoningii]